MENLIIGIGGRSGSGKSTIVRKLLSFFGPEAISLHTMDNYYLPRDMQIRDEHQYLNFDLPSSFHRENFVNDLFALKNGRDVELDEYVFNNDKESKKIIVAARSIILVEGLFIFYYPEVRTNLDFKILIEVPFEMAFQRRLQRDLVERNYDAEEIKHRYHNHAEPAYKKYIEPFADNVDRIISNDEDSERSFVKIKQSIQKLLSELGQRR